jgi:hypothetical protein
VTLTIRSPGGERDILIRWIGSDAVFTRAKDGKRSIVTANRGTSCARLALVARMRRIAEVHAAGALQQVARRRCHVAQLRRCAGEQRLREHRIIPLDSRMMSDRRVSRQRAEDQAAPRRRLDTRERESIDIDQLIGMLDIELHQVDQRGAACREANIGILLYCLGPGSRLNCLIHRSRSAVLKSLHCHSTALRTWSGEPVVMRCDGLPVLLQRCWDRPRSGRYFHTSPA